MEVNGISMIGLGQVSNNRFSHLRCSSPVTRIMLKVISAGGNTDANIRNNAIGDPAIPNCIFNNSAGQTYGIGLLSVNSARVIGNTICRISSDNGNNNAHMAGIHMQGEYIDSIAYNTIFHLSLGYLPPTINNKHSTEQVGFMATKETKGLLQLSKW